VNVPLYIGDAVSAAGYRLAGLRVHVPDSTAQLSAQIEQAAADAALVLLGADIAAQLPVAVLDRLLSSVAPAVVVVPDVRGEASLPDLARRLRQQLGVLE
jgi:vacuolar-type H+-ATPase subunit F/Vma7